MSVSIQLLQICLHHTTRTPKFLLRFRRPYGLACFMHTVMMSIHEHIYTSETTCALAARHLGIF
jgi:hypothetical protein